MAKKIIKAFTLVELILTISIVLIVSTAIFISMNVVQDQISFITSYQQAESMISEARNRSLTGESFTDTEDYDGDGDTTDLILPNGYIVNFVTDAEGVVTASLYADLFGSDVVGELDVNDEFLKSKILSDDVIFKLDVRTKTGGQDLDGIADPSDFSLIYTTPDAHYTIVNEPNTTLEIKIVQLDEVNDAKRTIYLLIHFLYGIPEILDEAYFQNP